VRPIDRRQHCSGPSVISSLLNGSYYHSYNVKTHFHNFKHHYIFCVHILHFTTTNSAFLHHLSCVAVNRFTTKEAVLRIQHQMKVKATNVFQLYPSQRKSLQYMLSPICIMGTLTIRGSNIFLYLYESVHDCTMLWHWLPMWTLLLKRSDGYPTGMWLLL
jgi:hypothetical protein